MMNLALCHQTLVFFIVACNRLECLATKPSLKGKAQYNEPPCANRTPIVYFYAECNYAVCR
jgi:hypothetical protein